MGNNSVKAYTHKRSHFHKRSQYNKCMHKRSHYKRMHKRSHFHKRSHSHKRGGGNPKTYKPSPLSKVETNRGSTSNAHVEKTISSDNKSTRKNRSPFRPLAKLQSASASPLLKKVLVVPNLEELLSAEEAKQNYLKLRQSLTR
jgi:hypothetical protein